MRKAYAFVICKNRVDSISPIREKAKDETFLCSTPFGSEWARMTTSAKRTVASQMSCLLMKE